jgi:hypothetical protein
MTTLAVWAVAVVLLFGTVGLPTLMMYDRARGR